MKVLLKCIIIEGDALLAFVCVGVCVCEDWFLSLGFCCNLACAVELDNWSFVKGSSDMNLLF